MAQISSKLFGVSAIDLYNRYRDDQFLHAEYNIIGLQILFGIIILSIFSLSFNYLYGNILHTFIDSISVSLLNHTPIQSQDIFDSIQNSKNKYFFILTGITILITIIFGYCITKITLRPTREAFKFQKRFISDIAHELRTPLTIIKTNTEVILLNNNINPNLQEILTSNIQELDRASEIINNLLSLNSMVQPDNIQFSDVNMCELIDSVIKKMSSLAEQKDITITTRKQGECKVWGNQTALGQIVENVLHNAITFTPKKGNVTISLEQEFNINIILTIKDTGIGISQKDLFHIFEPFYRGDQSRTRQSGSSGLGLTIVSELIKLHSGKIAIRSAIDKGTSVIITLPASTHNVEFPDEYEKDNEISVDFLSQS